MILERLPEVQQLPAAEKRQLAEELLLEADGAEEVETDAAVLALLERRLAEHKANPSAGSTWKEVKSRVFHRHGS